MLFIPSLSKFAPSLARCTAALAVFTAALLPGTAAAQSGPAADANAWPTRPVVLVVPFPPGGSADTLGRLLSKHLAERLGQSVLVDNRPGAGTAIAAALVSKAAPDGYTLLLTSGSTLTVNPAIRPNLPYDPVNSFDPVAIVTRIPLILLANPQVPIQTVADFVAATRGHPDKYNYASFGTGTTSHFTAEIVLHALGTKLVHIPYKGSSPAMTDLIRGQVSFSFDTVTAAIPQIKAGKVRPIAVTTAARSPQLPEVPTFAEAGFADVNVDTWLMLLVPKGTPEAVRGKLERMLADILKDPDAIAALAAQGTMPGFADGRAGAELIARELPVMREVARRADIQAD